MQNKQKDENKKWNFHALNDETFKNLVESMSESVWIWDKEEKTIYANQNFLKLVEYDLNEIIWRESYKFRDEESTKIVQNNNEIRKQWDRSKYEWILISKNWNKIPVFVSWTPLPWGWTAWIHTDLREIKSLQEAEEKLKNQLDEILKLQRELNRQIEALNNSSIVTETDPNLNITFVNSLYEKISWYSKWDVLWKKYDCEIINKHDQKENIIDYLKTWKIRKWELRWVNKDWLTYWTNTTITPFFWDDWNIYKYVIISNDITDIKKLNETKDEFLNIASHELRTPMTSIKWYISMILDWDTWEISNETKMFLERVFNSTRWLINLVNDMLDLSKLESWKMQYYDENISISDIINEIYQDFTILSSEKSIDFILEIDKSVQHEFIVFDRAKFKQLFINLLWNAFKFTTEWKWVKLSSKKIEKWVVRFEVSDWWLWIPQSFQEKIFDKFKQVDNYLQRNTNWTWLWLSICKEILSDYGSIMKLESKEWEWSRFYFDLELQLWQS